MTTSTTAPTPSATTWWLYNTMTKAPVIPADDLCAPALNAFCRDYPHLEVRRLEF